MHVPNASVLPNSSMPLAFLSPAMAYQLSVLTYFLISAGTVLILDILYNVRGEYKLLFQCKIGWPTIAYFVSRLSAFGFLATGILTQLAPIGRCFAWQKVHCTLYAVAISTSSLLFFLRVRAFFKDNRYFIAFCFFMWIAVLGGSMTLPFAVTGSNIGPTEYCMNDSHVKAYSAVSTIVQFVFDTFVFVAISCRLSLNVYNANTWGGLKLKTLLFGKSLPVLSRVLLYDNQKYYLATVIANSITIGIMFTDLPPTHKGVFTGPNIIFINVIMACLVYRNIKFRKFHNDIHSVEETRPVGMGQSGVALPEFEQPPYRSFEAGGDRPDERFQDVLNTGCLRRESKDTVV